MKSLSTRVAVAVMAAFVWACGDDDKASDAPLEVPAAVGDSNSATATPSNSSNAGNGAAQETDNGACSRSGFTPEAELASTAEFGLQYQALATGMPRQVMSTRVYTAFNGPTMPGTYVLDDINFADCGLCLLVLSDCGDDGCEKTFYADQGTVVIEEIGQDRFKARYEDVVYREVTLDGSTSIPVPGGETWCVDGYAFDQQVQATSGTTSGGGLDIDAICASDIACVGEQIPNFSVMSCATGEMVTLNQIFEGSRAGLLLATSGWCSGCSQRVPQVANALGDREGLKLAFILGETASYRRPSLTYCEQYARQKRARLEDMYIDNDGSDGHTELFGNIFTYPEVQGENILVSLPFHAVVDPADLTYVYGDGEQPNSRGDIEGPINTLLNQ